MRRPRHVAQHVAVSSPRTIVVVLCPELVGRDAELDRLRGRITALADGRGGVITLVGDAGAGKSRLLHEVATAAGAAQVPVLSGRAVPGDSPVAYRPLTEAFLAAFRGRPLPDDPSLAGFRVHLGRLIPAWSADAAADDSPVLLGEAIVRLLAVLAADRGCTLLLEDLQWADPETLAVVDYLVDALQTEAVLCVCTTRPDGWDPDVLSRVERRDPAAVVRVAPLDEAGVVRMVGACLASPEPPAGLSDFVRTHSDGNPFLVEELLAGLVAAGELRRVDGHWDVAGPLTPSVPSSLRASIQRRLADLDPVARRVLGAAALLGRHFEWELLPGVAEVDGRAVVDALRAAVDEQLIEAEADGFTFRHALTREAVLADLLPPERQALAARAWPAIELANPGLPGPVCELAADLAEAAGDRVAAASRLIDGARRALANGALATAEATARRARALAGADPSVALDADEVLLHVLAAAGKSGDALALGRDLAGRLAAVDVPAERQADLFIAMARAALVAGDVAAAGDAADAAGAIATVDAAPALRARVDAVAAEAALDRADLEAAELLARRAVDGARATAQPAVVCEALLVLGRVVRPRDRHAALDRFQEASDVASEAGLARWHLRAQQELALQALMTSGPELLADTREVAARYGAYLTVAVMDLALADVALGTFAHGDALRAATACVEASRRFGLATEPVAQLWLAGAHALGGDDAAMKAAIAAALARDPDDPRILGDLFGRVLATRALVRDELDTLPELLDQMMDHVRRAPPTTSVYPGRVLWAALHTVDDDDLGAAARAEFHDSTAPLGLNTFELCGEIIEAVALGRAGHAAVATARSTPAYDAATARPLGQGLLRPVTLIVARAAIRDGWGDPVRWLREAEAWFAERGLDRLVRRSRALLGEAGAPMPRRGRGDSEVPASLRALGVTSREVDVLKLVVDGRSTKEIAAALFLSPKTVERHLTSLFARTGAPNRRALAELGVAHLAN